MDDVTRRTSQHQTADSFVASPTKPSLRDTLVRLRYRYWPDHMLGEILAKRWTETAIPAVVLIIVAFALSRAVDGVFSPAALADAARQAGEIGCVVLGMALVMIVGGIDLSVGSTFALTDFCALYVMHILKWPVAAAVPITLLCGALLGAINGVLIGYFRLRAFITTLITLIIYRSAYDMLIQRFSTRIAAGFPDSDLWDWMGSGDLFGVPTVALVYAVIVVFGFFFMTRMRPGWHITAIGGSRRSAYNSGVAVRRTVAMCYVGCGVLTSIGALFFAARLATVGGDIGVGLEVLVLTAAVLGGISLGGGKGTVSKALVGTLIVLLITNGITTMGLPGGINRMALASILLLSAVIDIRWLKNRHRIVNKVYVSPTYHNVLAAPSTAPDCGTSWAINDKLRDVTVIGLGRIEGAEDVILDRDDNLYGGSRHGDIIRFFPPDYERMEVFAHIGGTPLGMAFDRWTTSMSASAAWGSIASRRTARSKRRPTKPTAACIQSTTTAACGLPTTWTLPMTAASSSPRRPCATRCTNGRPTASRRAATAASFATTPRPARRTPCCVTSSFPMASASRPTNSRSSLLKRGGARSNAIGSTGRNPARLKS
jgi:ribose transport system permease protein